MRNLKFGLLILLASSLAYAGNPIYFPELHENLTGTIFGGHNAADVWVQGGTLTFTEGATAAPGAAPPALDKVAGGIGADGFIHTLLTDNTGKLQIGITTSVLPTGASTSALQTTGNTSLGSIDTKTPALVSGRVPVDGSGVTQPVSGSVTANVGTTNGLALDATVSTAQPRKLQDGSGNAITSQTAGTNRGIHVRQLGSTATGKARNDYTGTSVTTSAYTQLIASTATETSEVEIFDSSGQTLLLAFGAAASEVDQLYITPGGNGRIKLMIPASTRVSIKAVSATASAGEIDVNLYD